MPMFGLFPTIWLQSHGLSYIPTDSDYNYAWWGCNLYTCPTAPPSPFCCCPLFSSSPRRRQTTTTRRRPRREHLSLVWDACEIFPKRLHLMLYNITKYHGFKNHNPICKFQNNPGWVFEMGHGLPTLLLGNENEAESRIMLMEHKYHPPTSYFWFFLIFMLVLG